MDYEVAVKQALEPVRRRYADTHQQLLKRATAANDIDTAVKIRDTLSQLEASASTGSSPERRFVGTRWTFPVRGKSTEQQWIEFRPSGVLQIGWDSALKNWKLLSDNRVELHPYSSAKYTFTIEFDSDFRKGSFVDSEFKGQPVERTK